MTVSTEMRPGRPKILPTEYRSLRRQKYLQAELLNISTADIMRGQNTENYAQMVISASHDTSKMIIVYQMPPQMTEVEL